MFRSPHSRPIPWLLVGCLLFVAACSGDDDGTLSPTPTGGGQERVLDYATFLTAVAPVLHERGCSASGDCHGGGIRGTFHLSPDHDRDPVFDFEQSVLQVDDLDPTASALLRKPLAVDAGGAPHAFTAFASIDDPDYRTILAWIDAGELRP